MNPSNKRKNDMEGNNVPKRVKKECSYGESCYRRNPGHLREFSHPHLESIIDTKTEDDEYPIPEHLQMHRIMILEQIEVIMEKQLYEPKKTKDDSSSSLLQKTDQNTKNDDTGTSKHQVMEQKTSDRPTVEQKKLEQRTTEKQQKEKERLEPSTSRSKTEERKSPREEKMASSQSSNIKPSNSAYCPVVNPTRRAEDYLKTVLPSGKMLGKHTASAPYHIFYTTIDSAKETHKQPYSITFLEILDRSLGELKCSLQINFMVEASWLLAQYYFAGYSEKKLTILYEDDCGLDLKNIHKKKPAVDAHFVTMTTPFGKHHTKMMLLCYEDGSLRVVISTANLYADDWENRTQGLWFSPKCPELPPDAMPHDGESPTMFKRSLLKYLNNYQIPQLLYYIERVKRCDFSQINVFLVASVPGSHLDHEWGMSRAGSLLRQHCKIPNTETRRWPLVAQASSLGSYGKEAKLWLTGDFLHNFTKIKDQSQLLSQPPDLKLIYPSFQNVEQSHDGLLGGGCLPYSADMNAKQPWLKDYLHQWRATHTSRNRAMPHIKSYTRVNPSNTMVAYFLLTSANVSKAAWGQVTKSTGALRLLSYECGVLLLPTFLINQDFFPLQGPNSLKIPYDLPPVKYEEGMTPWVSDYLR